MSLVEDNAIILSVTHTDRLLTTLFLGGVGGGEGGGLHR